MNHPPFPPHWVFSASTLIWPFSALIASAAWLCFRSSGRTLAEAGVNALMITYIAICLVIQTAAVLGRVWPAILMSVAAAGAASLLIWRFRFLAIETWRIFLDFFPVYPLAIATGAAAICFRGLWAAVEPTAFFFPLPAAETQSLAPLHITSLLGSQTIPFVYAYHFLTGMMAYGAIGLSTYTLSRRHAWPPAALTATLAVLSMPRLANPFQAPVSELITTAAALFVLVALYRTIESLRFDDLMMLVLGLSCTGSTHPMGWLLPCILTFLTVQLIHRRHGWLHLASLVREHPWPAAGVSAVAVIMWSLWKHSIGFIGQSGHSILRYNADGLSGAAVNLARYVLQSSQANPSAHTPWIRPLSLWWQAMLEAAYHNAFQLLGGNFGALAQFKLPADAGFGPLSLVLVLPAVGYTLFQGPRRLRAVAMAIAWYWFLLVLIPAWDPSSIQLLTPLMAISGFSVAFFLPPWRFSRTGHHFLNLLCLLSLCYSFLP